MKPDHLELLKKAQALELAGKPHEAAARYREFLEREPKHASAWGDFAGQLLVLGDLEAAQKACAAALELDPRQVSAGINLGVILLRQNRLDAAEGRFRNLLRMDPRRMDAQLFLAECLLGKRDLAGVQALLEAASAPGALSGGFVRLAPRLAEIWALLGLALQESKRWAEAESACAEALRIDPRNFRAEANLGSIRMALGQLEDAEKRFRQTIAHHPTQATARLLLITCLSRSGDLDAADQEIQRVIGLEPASFLVHKSVAGIHYSLGRWSEYRAELERFRKVDPASAYVDYEQSFADLLFGDMPGGWELYEARLRLPESLRPKRTFVEPTWSGGSFAGRTLLLWAEQGFGDTFMSLRYLPLVKALGGQVILEVQSALLDVAATCPGADAVIPRGAPLPPFDVQSSLMSLPWVFRTDLSSIPAEIPYLDVPAEVPHRQALLERLAGAPEGTRVGLVWAGSPGHGRDAERSIPARALAPLAALPGVAWFSFQLGEQEAPPLPNLVSLAPLLGNFSDTAYALSGMDLLVTVDTSVAHLAGAMGIPTLLLLSYQPDFRWLLQRDDSPWYPTLRLYRQPAYGDWASVVRQVLLDLTPEP